MSIGFDPAAGSYPGLSPYAYCANNPLKNVDPDGASTYDIFAGAFIAYADNALGGATSLRDIYVPESPSDYNTGQDIGDAASVIGGAAEAISGGATLLAEGAAIVGTGGSAVVVAVPAATGSAALMVHGASTAGAGGVNLVMQKGRASTGGSAEPKPLGNTAGDQPASLYEKYGAEGDFRKHGVTGSIETRYSKKQLAGGRLKKVDEGPRKEMLKKERERVEKNPGPENKEPWAGKDQK